MAASATSVLAISSHVVSGSVGNRAMVFALERRGHPVLAMPTVILPHHPGHGPVPRIHTGGNESGTFWDYLINSVESKTVSGIVTGYFASARQVEKAAELIEKIKDANPAAHYLCDPVLGDANSPAPGSGKSPLEDGTVYVAPDVAAAVRDRLLPLADTATPNRFECAWLVGNADRSPMSLEDAARRLPPDTVVVTSVAGMIAGTIGNLLVAPQAVLMAEHRMFDTAVKGTGDLFAALFLSHILETGNPANALQGATDAMLAVLASAARRGMSEMPLAAAQDALVRPVAQATVRRLIRPSPVTVDPT